MRILLIDNSKPDCAIFTPKLAVLLAKHGEVTACRTREETISVLDSAAIYDAIVLSGSSLNMSESLITAAISKDLMILLRFPDVPCLGVCFGMQLIAVAYGGKVERLLKPRNGEFHITNTYWDGLSGNEIAYFSHQDVVTAIPPNFTVDGTSDGYVAMMHSTKLKRYGVQFHPECSNDTISTIVSQFLKMAMKQRICVTTELSLTYHIFREISFYMGCRSINEVSREYGMTRENIVQIWNHFRKMFRIPAMLF